MILRHHLSAGLRLAAVAAACAFCFTLGPAAAQQPTSQPAGVLPGLPAPLGGDGDISTLISALMLSVAQEGAIAEPMRRYWADWREVQEAEFSTYAPREAEVSMMPWRRPDSNALNAFVTQRRRIEATLRNAETSLFVAIADVLSEPQMPLLDDLRVRRDRAFLASDHIAASWFDGRPPLDLRDLLARCNIGAESLGNDAIVSYDIRMNNLLQRLNAAIEEARTCWMKRTEDAPFPPIDPNTPFDELAQHKEVFRAWSECLRPASQIVAECFRVSSEAVRKIGLLLPADDARLLEATYFAYEFGEVFPRNLALECVLLEASRSSEVDPATREQLRYAYERWIKEVRPLEWAIADGLSARRVRMPPGLQISLGRPTQAEELRMRSIPAGEELYQKTQQLVFASEAVPSSLVKEMHGRVWRERAQPLESESQRRQPLGRATASAPGQVPDPLNEETAQRIAGVLEQAVNPQSVAAVLGPYAQSYRQTINELRAAASGSAGPRSRIGLDPERERVKLNSDLAQRLATLDEQAIAASESAGLPPDVALLVRLRRAYEWAAYSRHTSASSLLGSPVDFTRVLEVAGLQPGDRSRACAMMLEQAPALIAALNDYRTTLAHLREASELSSASRWLRPQPADEQTNATQAWQAVREVQRQCETSLQTAAREGARAHVQLLTTQRTMLDQICADMAEEAVSALRHEFAAQAFPNVLADLVGARNRLNRAMRFPSLLPEQRDKLGEAAIGFNAECEERFKDSVAFLWSLALAQNQSEEVHSFSSLQIDQMRLDQQRLANGMNAKLRTILSTEQLAGLGLDPPTY